MKCPLTSDLAECVQWLPGSPACPPLSHPQIGLCLGGGVASGQGETVYVCLCRLQGSFCPLADPITSGRLPNIMVVASKLHPPPFTHWLGYCSQDKCPMSAVFSPFSTVCTAKAK